MSGTITSLDPDPRHAGAVRVSVNGKSYCAVRLEDVSRLGLRPGMELDEARMAALDEAANAQAAYRAALAAIARRGFARRELERRLIQRGHPPRAVGQALDRAESVGLLNDQQFAEHFVAAKAARGRGPSRLRRDLFMRGVAQGIVDAVLEAHFGSEPDLRMPRELAERRAAQLRGLPQPVRRRR
ncbi:MAG: regulatory protein RecX, partial [Gemmatimonadales bacterium]